ncbi:DUF305 domain-containing protein [Nocardiopsis oceani]
MTLRKRALTAASAAFATGLFAAACGNGAEDTPATAPENGQQTTEFNEADVHFAQMMVPHHEQAVEMADLADTRAGEEVLMLAEEIRDAQGPEIEQMEALLDGWEAEVEHGMDHSEMDGMLTEDQMGKLETARGDAFDTLFLEFMVLHHEGAVDMSETQIEEGVNLEAGDLAEEIIDAQEREIEEMHRLLGIEEPGDQSPGGGDSDSGDADDDGHSDH